MVLVTGGAGYIGSHMLRQLVDQGEPCAALDNLEGGHRAAIPDGVPLIEVDLKDADGLVAALQPCARNADAVVLHFAGSISVGESVRAPAKYFENNLGASLNLIKAMESLGLDKLVFSSTAAVYGEPEQIPIPEGHTKRPLSPYGESKLAVEHALAASEIRSVSLRYFNAAGAHSSGSIGEAHDPEEHLVPLAIQAALGHREPLTILGDEYQTPDGTCIRDYIHVMDLVDAHTLAIHKLRQGTASATFNLGTGQGTSVRELLLAVGQAVGKPVPHTVGARRPGDPARLIADVSAIEAAWGWRAQRNLAEIVASAAVWHRNHPKGYGGA